MDNVFNAAIYNMAASFQFPVMMSQSLFGQVSNLVRRKAYVEYYTVQEAQWKLLEVYLKKDQNLHYIDKGDY